MTIEQQLSHLVGETISQHKMIRKGDRIMLALSGGKDSYAMLDILLKLQKKSPVKFELLPAIVDSGFGMDYAPLAEYLRSRGLHLIVRKENIKSIVSQKVDTKDTGKCCSLCSRLRRGILYTMAREHNCNKLALGHNLDDSIGTFLLNIFYVSRLDTMRPIYLAEDKKTTVIRPLINVPESLIVKYSKEKRFPIVKQDCLFKKEDSKRKELKAVLAKLSKNNQGIYPSLSNVIAKMGSGRGK